MFVKAMLKYHFGKFVKVSRKLQKAVFAQLVGFVAEVYGVNFKVAVSIFKLGQGLERLLAEICVQVVRD